MDLDSNCQRYLKETAKYVFLGVTERLKFSCYSEHLVTVTCKNEKLILLSKHNSLKKFKILYYSKGSQINN